MSIYADSSALVKLYANEDGSAAVRRLDDEIVVAEIARVEVASALWRKHRTGTLAAAQVRTVVGWFEADWFGTASQSARFVAVSASASLLESAARLVAVHGLRAYDGVQLATALRVRDIHAQTQTFAAFDGELRSAAAAEGFTLLP